MSTFARFNHFLTNPRNFILTACGCSLGIFAVKAAPVAFPNYLHRPLTEAYKGNSRCLLDESQVNEFKAVCEDFKSNPDQYNLYVTYRWNVESKGLPYLANGVHYAIPYILKGDPNVANARFAFSSKLDSPEGHSFKNSLLMSENARKFALAREVVKIEKNHPVYGLIAAPAAVMLTFGAAMAIQLVSGLLPLVGTCAVTGVITYWIYKYSVGIMNELLDHRIDKAIFNVGEHYVIGAVEYYNKMLQRNVSLRDLLGSKGKSLYNYHGNMVQNISAPHGAPLTMKRDKAKLMLLNKTNQTDVKD